MTALRESIHVKTDKKADDWSHVRGFGWRPQLPDVRDRLYAIRLKGLPPAEYDLRPSMPPVYDQGQLGSCTGNAIAAAMEYERDRQGLSDFVPSRLFIYYNERALEGTVSSDSGAVIRDGIKVVNRDGVCPEALWPYDIGVFTVKPPKRCYVEAETDKAVQYEGIQTLVALKDAIASNLAVVFGFTVYASFESPMVAQTGVMPMPKKGEATVGGHAVLAVGYSDAEGHLIVRNSWGPSWGDKGYFYMPYEYLTGTKTSPNDSPINGAHLASDFWAIQMVAS
ncbi:Cysteine protease, C1A family [Mycobacterium numidiamassiliense]|uniref:Cysteine protease, C1A family n=1 Tax=Mycobacterium numidiamassiliense TaxID=1841861 RepID=A0A2U3P850_9MYCO|nr:C1 family peptidase [Mycobacterium numidiamassiliense]SPM39927.1 Cysteine protease, C1A family [Mycobacterium numidiamassiliense]